MILTIGLLSACTMQDKPQPKNELEVRIQDLRGKDAVVDYRYEARYPQLTNMQNKAMQDQVNRKIRSFVARMAATPPELRKDPLPESYKIIEPEVTLTDHGLLSVAFYTDQGWKRSTHPALGVETLNIDVHKGIELELASLFVKGSDYLDIIARETRRQLSSKLGPEIVNVFKDQLTPELKNYSYFTLSASGLNEHFSDCRLSCVSNNTTVTISYQVLRDYILPNGPLQWAR